MDSEVERPVVGEVCLRRRRRQRQNKLLKKLFLDYSQNTTLHGLRYTTLSGLHIYEKIFWLVTFIVSVALSFYLISKVWTKWNTSPVIVSFAEKHVFVHKVPFPAMTICPAVKFFQSKFNYTEVMYNKDKKDYIDNETLADAYAINLLCDFPDAGVTPDTSLNSSAINAIFNISIDASHVIQFCNGARSICGEYGAGMFDKVLTADGVCFTTNGLAARHILNVDALQKDFLYSYVDRDIKNWTFEDGYINDNDDTYPYRGQESFEKPFLAYQLFGLEKNADTLCNTVLSGYKIYLHHPYEWPQSSSYNFAVLPQQLSSMAIKITMVTTSEDLRPVSLKVRQCYFAGERPLKYFKIYTYNHCRLECLTNYTYNACQCVQHYMPSNSTTICASQDDLMCSTDAEESFAMKGSTYMKKCKCLPACNFIQYDAEIHKTDLNMDSLFKTLCKYYKSRDIDISQYLDGWSTSARAELYFKEPMFMAVHRSELFGLTDFLGICGGLLGLFLGFSFLSIVEIFYFLTFRVYKTIKTDLRNEKLNNLIEKKK